MQINSNSADHIFWQFDRKMLDKPTNYPFSNMATGLPKCLVCFSRSSVCVSVWCVALSCSHLFNRFHLTSRKALRFSQTMYEKAQQTKGMMIEVRILRFIYRRDLCYLLASCEVSISIAVSVIQTASHLERQTSTGNWLRDNLLIHFILRSSCIRDYLQQRRRAE